MPAAELRGTRLYAYCSRFIRVTVLEWTQAQDTRFPGRRRPTQQAEPQPTVGRVPSPPA